MALRGAGGGNIPGITTEAQPISTYKATTPAVGDFVQIQNSGGLALGVNSCAAAHPMNGPMPWGVVQEVRRNSNIVTVEWANVRAILTFEYSGTMTVGNAIIGVNTARNNKVSAIATLAVTSIARPVVVAIDKHKSGYLQAFLMG